MTRTRVVILGNSHVHRLKNFIDSNAQFNDFAFGDDPEVRCYGIGGGRINDAGHCTRWEQQIADRMPHHLIFHAGGNDLDDKNCSENYVNEILFRLIAFLNMIQTKYKLVNVIVMQLLPRFHTRN
jgi:hypothetical protein